MANAILLKIINKYFGILPSPLGKMTLNSFNNFPVKNTKLVT